MDSSSAIHGYVAEFEKAEQLVAATRRTRLAGYRVFDAYSPFPVHGLDEAMGHPRTILPWLVFLGGLAGGVGGYLLQYYPHVIDYPLNVGGRPLNSWPSFIPVTFEMTILGAALVAVFGMIILNGLPQHYHPIFNLERFERASQDRFFLCIETKDPKFNKTETREFLLELGASEVSECEE